jgi:hypothetical protein
MILALIVIGAVMLTWCATCSGSRQAPTNLCLERYKEVAVLLQAGQTLEARARAVLINCELVRIQALKLVERSRPIRWAHDTVR